MRQVEIARRQRRGAILAHHGGLGVLIVGNLCAHQFSNSEVGNSLRTEGIESVVAGEFDLGKAEAVWDTWAQVV